MLFRERVHRLTVYTLFEGNRYVQRVMQMSEQGGSTPSSRPLVQPKLRVMPARDRYEREADYVARQVVTASESQEKMQARRKGMDKETLALRHRPRESELVLRRNDNSARLQVGLEGGDVGPDIAQSIEGARGRGQPLPDGWRTSMEDAFGLDYSAVRVHAGAQADALNRLMNARAFTTGQDIFFKEGEYDLGSSAGREVLAHELTHVVQQNGAREIQRQEELGRPEKAQLIHSQRPHEILAHGLAYTPDIDLLKPEDRAVLEGAGYDLESFGWHLEQEHAFQYVWIEPAAVLPEWLQTAPRPILAFRGTVPSELENLRSDLRVNGVGREVFRRYAAQVSQKIDDLGPPVDLTGHSLGGALAQHAALNFPGTVNQLVTFQAPGIGYILPPGQWDAAIDQLAGKVVHHIATRDVVDLAGGYNIPGQYYVHQLPGIAPVATHMADLLTSLDNTVWSYDRYPFSYRLKALPAEALRVSLGVLIYAAETVGETVSQLFGLERLAQRLFGWI